MPDAVSEEGESTKYEVAGDAVRGNDDTAVFDGIFDENFAVIRTGKFCNFLCVMNGFVNDFVSANVAQAAAREYGGCFRDTEVMRKFACVANERYFFGDGPSFINTDGCEEDLPLVDEFPEA